jgi:lipoprotein-anchoring transpeptidase ErfK/SrfK
MTRWLPTAMLAALASAFFVTPAHAADPGAPTSKRAWIAHVVAPTAATRRPGSGRVVARIGTHAPWNGGPVGLLVLAAHERWLKVLLPQRPNGATGWIPQARTVTHDTPWRVTVSLRSRRIRLLRHGAVVASSQAVIGKPSTPTPRGRFAIAERVPQPDPHGFLGPWALLLTAHSDVLDDYGGGPGRVAIHGRDGASLLDPLGSAASHGCIRVPNRFVRQLARHASEGTPVDVR